MGTTLNKKSYTKLIEENILELEKHMPEHSLEKKHSIEVLKWSVNALYEGEGLLVNKYDSKINKRITDLQAEKEELLSEYPEQNEEIQSTMAMANTRISMELNFLNELKNT